MAWARLDDALAFHEKIVDAGNAATGVWVRMIAWSSQHLTDGAVPDKVARLIARESRGALASLVRSRLCKKTTGGYEVNDYLEYNPSRAEVLEKREKDRHRKTPKSKRTPRGKVSDSSPPDPTRSRPDPTRSSLSSEGTHTIGDVLAQLQEWDGWQNHIGLPKKWEKLGVELSPFTDDEIAEARARAEGVNGKPSIGLWLRKVEQIRNTPEAQPSRRGTPPPTSDRAPQWEEWQDPDAD